jgi:hypothetical protein
MLAGGLLVLLFLPERMPLSDTDLRWTVGLLLGALLEHINYYHYQLMYDTRAAFDHLRRHGRLRKAALGIDMARARLTRIADGCER